MKNSKSKKAPASKKPKIDYAEIQKEMEIARARVARAGIGGESFLMTFHVVRDGKLYHHWEYKNFPSGDWPTVVMATSVEGKRAQMLGTAKSTI